MGEARGPLYCPERNLIETQLQSWLTEWQRRLRLQDWLVHVKVVREREMEHGPNQGEISYVLAKRMAIMRVLDPIDYPDNAMVPYDMEQTVVHELLHLHFAPFVDHPHGSLEHTCMEQTIDALAGAFVTLKRSSPRTRPETERAYVRTLEAHERALALLDGEKGGGDDGR